MIFNFAEICNIGSVFLCTALIFGCSNSQSDADKHVQSNVVTNSIGVLGEGWHYAIRHNTGNAMEDDKGCPCVTLASGYSSYCNLTNAIAHGKGSVYNELCKMRKAEGDSNRLCNIVDIVEVEKRIMKEIQEESKCAVCY